MSDKQPTNVAEAITMSNQALDGEEFDFAEYYLDCVEAKTLEEEVALRQQRRKVSKRSQELPNDY